MNIEEILSQPESRRLEFKGLMPENSDLAKTIVAFANDAGGDLYIGVNDKTRELVGIPEDELVKMEEQISNIIFDRCYPAILPDISFCRLMINILLKSLFSEEVCLRII